MKATSKQLDFFRELYATREHKLPSLEEMKLDEMPVERVSSGISWLMQRPKKKGAVYSGEFAYDLTPIPEPSKKVRKKWDEICKPYGIKLYSHQIAGNEYLKDFDKFILNFSQGLGKTYGILSLLRYWGEINIVLVAKSALLDDMWKVELAKIKYPLPIYDLRETKVGEPFEYYGPGIHIVNNESCWRRELTNFEGIDFTLVIDEMTEFSAENKQTNGIKKWANLAERVAMLTGSIFDGKLEKCFPALQILGTDMTYSQFEKKYMKMKSVGRKWFCIGYKNKRELVDYAHRLGCFTVRKEQALELPSRSIEFAHISQSNEYKKLISVRKFKQKNGKEIKGQRLYAKESPDGEYYEILPVIKDPQTQEENKKNELIVYANNWAHRKMTSYLSKPKLEYLKAFLEECDERAVITYRLQEEENEIVKILKELKKPFSIKAEKKRSTSEDGFRNNEDGIMLAQEVVSAKGQNWQEASIMIFFAPPQKDDDFNQLLDRIHRIGSQNKVRYIFLSTVDSPEEKRFNALAKLAKENIKELEVR